MQRRAREEKRDVLRAEVHPDLTGWREAVSALLVLRAVAAHRMTIRGMAMSVLISVGQLVIFSHEHRRDILEAVFRLHTREVATVVQQLVRDLINDERRLGVRRERVEGRLQ